MTGAGRVGSRPAGYERGSALLTLKRDEADEPIEEAASLLAVEFENVDVIDKRDRHDEPDDEVELVAVVFVDAIDAIELRPACYQSYSPPTERATYVIRVSAKTFSESSAVDASPIVPRCVASTPPGCRHVLPSWRETPMTSRFWICEIQFLTCRMCRSSDLV
jgi:hypothetical protein